MATKPPTRKPPNNARNRLARLPRAPRGDCEDVRAGVGAAEAEAADARVASGGTPRRTADPKKGDEKHENWRFSG